MTPLEALLELLERVGASQGAAVLVSEEELSRWPAEAVRELKSQKLLVKASPAASVVCPAASRNARCRCIPCLPGRARQPRSLCATSGMTSTGCRSAERLRQWRCGAEAVGAFVAQSLGLRPDSQRKAGAGCGSLAL